MENFAELMQRLLEIQSGGRQRSPELIEEDARLIDRLKRTLTRKPTQTVRRSQDTRRADAIQGPTSPP
jgi:predicted transcriptional regulator